MHRTQYHTRSSQINLSLLSYKECQVDTDTFSHGLKTFIAQGISQLCDSSTAETSQKSQAKSLSLLSYKSTKFNISYIAHNLYYTLVVSGHQKKNWFCVIFTVHLLIVFLSHEIYGLIVMKREKKKRTYLQDRTAKHWLLNFRKCLIKGCNSRVQTRN